MLFRWHHSYNLAITRKFSCVLTFIVLYSLLHTQRGCPNSRSCLWLAPNNLSLNRKPKLKSPLLHLFHSLTPPAFVPTRPVFNRSADNVTLVPDKSLPLYDANLAVLLWTTALFSHRPQSAVASYRKLGGSRVSRITRLHDVTGCRY